MVEHGDDKINEEIYQLDLEAMDEVSYLNSSILMFHTIRKQKGMVPIYFEKPEVQRYIKVDFI